MYRHSHARTVFSLFAAFLLVSPACAAPFEITDQSGTVFVGELTQLDAQQIVLEQAGKSQTFSLENLTRIRNLAQNPLYNPLQTPLFGKSDSPAQNASPDRRPGRAEQRDNTEKWDKYAEPVTVVDFTDGSRLVVTAFQFQGRSATCNLLDKKELTLPVDRILAVRFGVQRVADAVTPPEDWRRLAIPSREEAGDRIVVGQPDSLDFYEGVLVEGGPDTISFIMDGETLPVPQRKVFGLVFSTKESGSVQPSTYGGVMSLFDGGQVQLAALTGHSEENSAGYFVWTSAAGVTGMAALDAVETIDFRRKHAVFLAELTPIRTEQFFLFAAAQADNQPFSAMARTFRVHRLPGIERERSAVPWSGFSIQDTRQAALPDWPVPGLAGVKLDGTVYDTGMLLPAGMVLEYALTEPFATLQGTVGIDDRLRPNGAARLVIDGDARRLGEVFLRGDEPAQRLEIPLSGDVRALRLAVEFESGISMPGVIALGEMKLLRRGRAGK